ncbi:LOW QUALITY PROTEIN: ejaculatory bulb-specific protein 3-like, partial [Euwallacea fornicatus]|uniref:LOW QUALITY PROTEIN: ejaculatory bulb-specific protein 3-like n=1 Tax=Euwallacea fornicatus TaxID=995702 RepID=UPI00338D94FA
LVLSVVGSPIPDQYTSKYDNVDVDQISHSDRLLSNYINCLLDKENCSPDAIELKKNLPDAFGTDCSKCSAKQKEGVRKVVNFLIENKKNYWKELEKKYDPEGKYYQKY